MLPFEMDIPHYKKITKARLIDFFLKKILYKVTEEKPDWL